MTHRPTFDGILTPAEAMFLSSEIKVLTGQSRETNAGVQLTRISIIAVTIAGALLLAVALLVSVSGPPAQKGVLYGVVTIGPICPVEMENVPCPTPPEAYQARKMVVFGSDAKTIIETVSLDDNGNYRTELLAGTYVVDINHVGIDRSNDVPRTITIAPGENVRLDINIDTGIR